MHLSPMNLSLRLGHRHKTGRLYSSVYTGLASGCLYILSATDLALGEKRSQYKPRNAASRDCLGKLQCESNQSVQNSGQHTDEATAHATPCLRFQAVCRQCFTADLCRLMKVQRGIGTTALHSTGSIRHPFNCTKTSRSGHVVSTASQDPPSVLSLEFFGIARKGVIYLICCNTSIPNDSWNFVKGSNEC